MCFDLQLYVSALDEVQDGDTGPQRNLEQEDDPQDRATPITVATLAGKLEAKLKMKANDNLEGPKVSVFSFRSRLSVDPGLINEPQASAACYMGEGNFRLFYSACEIYPRV